MLRIKEVNIHDFVIHTPSKREGEVVKIDKANNKIEVKFEDGTIIKNKPDYFEFLLKEKKALMKTTNVKLESSTILINHIFLNNGNKPVSVFPHKTINFPDFISNFISYVRSIKNDSILCIRNTREDDGFIGVIINSEQGVIVFKIYDKKYSIDELKQMNFYNYCLEQQASLISMVKQYFLKSKALIVGPSMLKFPYKTVLLFQNVDLNEFSEKDRMELKLYKDVCFKDLTSNVYNYKLFDNFYYKPLNFLNVDKQLIPNIIERIAPEYTTIDSFKPISCDDYPYKSLLLDDSQIQIINNLNYGVKLYLSNPGTSKSVILISKAFKVASSNKRVLITCFNKNLAKQHQRFMLSSRLNNTSLTISTFHSLIKEILLNNDKNYYYNHPYEEDDNNFGFCVDHVKYLIDNHKITKVTFDAIFIDEVQLFKTEWIDICYNLLDIKEKSIFEMYGDSNQDIKCKDKYGKSPWRKSIVNKYIKDVKYLPINYRNSQKIVDYINPLMLGTIDYLKNNGVNIDFESCLTVKAKNKGKKIPVIIKIAQNNIKEIVKYVNKIKFEHDCDYTDIAIIYPYYSFDQFYKPGYFIEKSLVESKIPFHIISNKFKPESTINGVIISTVDSCMGLDFKYVILCGLHSLDFYHDKIRLKCKKLYDGIKIRNYEALYSYAEAVNKIYTACSRAKEELYIMDDLDDDSPLKEVIYHSKKSTYVKEFIKI